MEDKAAEDRKDEKDEKRSEDADQPRTQHKLDGANRGNEGMFERLRPEIIEEDISNIDLANLGDAHRKYTREDESGHVGFQLKKVGQKSYGNEPHHGPEEDLEETEDISLRHDPVLKYEGPYLNQFLLQIQQRHLPNPSDQGSLV
jgi:hypothetical protein